MCQRDAIGFMREAMLDIDVPICGYHFDRLSATRVGDASPSLKRRIKALQLQNDIDNMED